MADEPNANQGQNQGNHQQNEGEGGQSSRQQQAQPNQAPQSRGQQNDQGMISMQQLNIQQDHYRRMMIQNAQGNPDPQMVEAQQRQHRAEREHHERMMQQQQQQMGQIPYSGMPQGHQSGHPSQQQQISQQHQQQQMALQQQQMNQHHQQSQAQQQAVQRKQWQNDQVNCTRINEEMMNLCHLDSYIGKFSNIDALYKKTYRLHQRGKESLMGLQGTREKKRPEPPKEIAHQDFMLKEMQDMAIDFHEETYLKRYKLAQLAYEAQSFLLKKVKAKNQKDGDKKNQNLDAHVIDSSRIVNVPPNPKPIGADFNPFPIAPEINDPFPNDQDFMAVPGIENDIDILSNLDEKHEIKSDFGDNLQIKDKQSPQTKHDHLAMTDKLEDHSLKDKKKNESQIEGSKQIASNKNTLWQDFDSKNHETFINRMNILMKDDDILNDFDDIDKRNEEFDKLDQNTKVDKKYAAYKQDEMLIQPPEVYLTEKRSLSQERKEPHLSIYQNSIVGYIQNAFEDKREDLESKRVEVENNFRKSEAINFHKEVQRANEAAISMLEREGDDKQPAGQMLDKPMNNSFNQFDVDSIFNANGQAQRGRQMGNERGPNYPSMRAGSTTRDQFNTVSAFNPNQSSFQAVLNQPGQDFVQIPADNQIVLQSLSAANGSSTLQSSHQTETMNAEVAYYNDVFEFYDQKMNETETRSHTRLIQDDELYDLPLEDCADENIGAVHPNNQANLRNSMVLNNHTDNFDIDNFNDELNQELDVLNNQTGTQPKAQVLKGVYRDGENFMEDVCTQTDRELMRMFPPVTEPEHTKIQLDVVQKRRFWEFLQKEMDKIESLNYQLIQEERLDQAKDPQKIAQLKEDIKKAEAYMWDKYKDACIKREQASISTSQKFKNVYSNQPQTMKELRRRINENNRRFQSSERRNHMQMFSDSEVAFLKWYVSIFGENMRLIANVLNYHPFTRGYLRSKESLKPQFIFYMQSATHANLLNENSVIKPWRTSGMPLLISERPPSLYSSIKQINQMHHTCIKNYDLKRLQPKKQHILRLVEGPDGLLTVQYVGMRDNPQAIQNQQQDNRSRALRRTRDQMTQDVEPVGEQTGAIEEAKTDDQVMNTQRAFRDAEMIDQDVDSYITQFYLGQKIDEVLKGDLKKPQTNFDFLSYHDRRTTYSKLFKDSKKQVYKRQRIGTGEGLAKNQNNLPSREQTSSGRLRVTPEEMNTPMFCALQENKPNNKTSYLKSVLHQSGIIFWLGYLYKKIAQNRCEQRVCLINERGLAALKQQEKKINFQIQEEHIREAKRIRITKANKRQNPDYKTPKEIQEQRRKAQLVQEMINYIPERFTGLINQGQVADEANPSTNEFIYHLWPDHKSIFFYDRERLNYYQDQENEDLRGERKLDSIIGLMETKWARMDRYWFQKNRHLDQKMRKKKDAPGVGQPAQQQEASAAQPQPSAQNQVRDGGLMNNNANDVFNQRAVAVAPSGVVSTQGSTHNFSVDQPVINPNNMNQAQPDAFGIPPPMRQRPAEEQKNMIGMEDFSNRQSNRPRGDEQQPEMYGQRRANDGGNQPQSSQRPAQGGAPNQQPGLDQQMNFPGVPPNHQYNQMRPMMPQDGQSTRPQSGEQPNMSNQPDQQRPPRQ